MSTSLTTSIRSIGGRERSNPPPESLMLIKTRANLLPAIEFRLRELHSYDIPEKFIAIPISLGAQPYLDWLLASTGASPKSP